MGLVWTHHRELCLSVSILGREEPCVHVDGWCSVVTCNSHEVESNEDVGTLYGDSQARERVTNMLVGF